MRTLASIVCAVALTSCSSLVPTELPAKRPPLADMVESLELAQEPKDEAERVKLPFGSFTGVYATDARRTLDELEGDAAGVRVARVVENSPGDAAGIEEGDILVEVAVPGIGRRSLSYPSQWRDMELTTDPGTRVAVTFDRAGVERRVELVVAQRLHAPDRQDVVRLREELKVGIVLRSATEVEARAAGLGPGGGAVVVGLAGGSPWRSAGLEFGDLIVTVGGRQVGHPQAVLDAIRDAAEDEPVAIEFVRGAERRTVDAAVSARAAQITHFSVPVVFSYDSARGDTEWSALLGLVSYESTIAAWRLRLLWLIKLGGGDADELVPVNR